MHAYHAKETFCVGCQVLAPARRQLAERKAPEGVSVTLARAGH